MNPVFLKWSRNPRDARAPYYKLYQVDLSGSYIQFPGVFVIFPLYRTGYIYVGQALNIGEALRDLRLQAKLPREEIGVTWARVDEERTRLGIERYLAEKFGPTTQIPRADCPPIECNHPYLS